MNNNALLIIIGFWMVVSAFTAEARSAMKEEYLAFPVLAMLPTGPASVKIGSGFYYRTDTSFYFITARHLLFDKEKDELLGNDLQLVSYGLDILTDPKKRILKVNLRGLHLDKSIFVSDVDVAVLRLGDFQEMNEQEGVVNSSPHVTRVTPELPLRPARRLNVALYDESTVSNEAYLMGYPTDLVRPGGNDFNPELPLLRRGIIAGKHPKTKTIVLDCPSYGGNSGGPVVEVIQTSLTETKYKIVGILVRMVPFVQTWRNLRFEYDHHELSNSGYSVVIPMDVPLALIEAAEKAEIEQSKKEGGEERRDEEGSGDAEKVDDEREHKDLDCGLSDGNVPVIQRRPGRRTGVAARVGPRDLGRRSTTGVSAVELFDARGVGQGSLRAEVEEVISAALRVGVGEVGEG